MPQSWNWNQSDEEPSETDSQGSGPPDAPQGFVRSSLFFYGVMGCIALVWRMSEPGVSIFHPAEFDPETVWSPASAVFAGVVVGLVAIGISEVLTEMTSLGDALADMLGESLAGLTWADAILLALASGTAEEMLFRGALQPAVGLFWASLVFGACHFLPRKELALWSAYAVVMGFAFGALFEWTGHLLAPIAAHTVVNGVNLPRLAKRYEDGQAEESTAASISAGSESGTEGAPPADGGDADVHRDPSED